MASIDIPKAFSNSIGMEFVYIPAGEFIMGAIEDYSANEDEKPAHRVKISKGFYMGKYPVTQKEWISVMMHNPSEIKEEGIIFKDKLLRNPVESVSWDDVQLFIKKLNKIDVNIIRKVIKPFISAIEKYRLPTEAEWEYSARAGRDKYSLEDHREGSEWYSLKEHAWFAENSNGRTHQPVGLKKPNAFNLHDMLGNVWEWCEDWYDGKFYQKDKETIKIDPINLIYSKYKILRGGSWLYHKGNLRVSHQYQKSPDESSNDIGFRIVLPVL